MKRTWLLRSSCTKSLAADSNYSNTIKCQEIIIFSHHILCLCIPFPVYTLKPYYMLFPLSRTLSPVFIPALTLLTYILVVVQSLSHVQLFVTSWTEADQASLSFTISWSLFKSMSIELVMLANQLILYHRLLLLPSVFPSIRVFSRELTLCIRCPKYWRFSFSINPSSEYSGLISFRIDWFDLFGVQGTLKSLLQHHSSNTLARRSEKEDTTRSEGIKVK